MPATDPARAASPPTVGILFPGELGSAFGRSLSARGIPVVTTLDERSDRTRQLCNDAGLNVLDSLEAVVEASDVLVSVVSPSAATAVATRVAAAMSGRSGTRILYLDINSISPVTMTKVASILDRPDVEVVDGSILGLASRLPGAGTILLSGPAAGEVAGLIGTPPRAVLLGDDIGRASLMKMLIGGVNKGLVALLLELSDVALECGVLDEFWAICRESYPGVMEPFERLLPTYPQHVGRRSEEMAELEVTVSAAGKPPIMSTAARTLFARAARSKATLDALAERIARNQVSGAGLDP